MVKRRQTVEPVSTRKTSPAGNRKDGNNNQTNQTKIPRQCSAKRETKAAANDQTNTLKTTSDYKPSGGKQHGDKPADNNTELGGKIVAKMQITKKQLVRDNDGKMDVSLEELQWCRNKLITKTFNKELFKNMRESMLSMNVLANGLAKHAAQIRQQQKYANRVWDDLEAQFMKLNGVYEENNHRTSIDESTPGMLPLPNIDSVSRKSSDISRQNSLPSVFRNTETPAEKESEIFTTNRTNNIRKVAQRRTKEKSNNAADLFPAVIQDRGMPQLRLTASGNDAKSKLPTIQGSKEAKQRVAKRLLEMKAFQDKYIVEPNKSSNSSNEHRSNQDLFNQELMREINKRLK